MNGEAAATWRPFTAVAANYGYKALYADRVLKCLAHHVGSERKGFRVADVGAGSGKLTKMLAELGMAGDAVEPNEAMRIEGRRFLGKACPFRWREGSAEDTGLPDGSVDWICMATAFHWADEAAALKEFRRVLRPGGYFTAMWNLRDFDKDPLQRETEERIREMEPNLQRAYFRVHQQWETLSEILQADGCFGELLYMEAPHDSEMTQAQYEGFWRAIHDIPSQVGEARWEEILSEIMGKVAGRDRIVVRHLTRAWTVQLLPGRP